MTILYVDSIVDNRATTDLIQSAVDNEIARLKLSLEIAQSRLTPFEVRYDCSSDHFLTNMAAEDLEGGDDEYVQWAGEYHLYLALQQKLALLEEVEYSDISLLRRS